jgi:hypothetical protein
MVATRQELASQLAQAHFVGSLRRVPPYLDFDSPADEAEFTEIGQQLAGMLLEPSRVSVIRCAYTPDRANTRALVTVHDRRLALFQRRGRPGYGTRLTRTSVVDITMVRSQGLRALLTWCPTCGDGHELTLRSLERAAPNAESDRTFQVPAGFEDALMPEQPIFIYEGDLPQEPAWYPNAAFALAVGPLQRLWYVEPERMALGRFANEFIPRQETTAR